MKLKEIYEYISAIKFSTPIKAIDINIERLKDCEIIYTSFENYFMTAMVNTDEY